ncbi:putative beta-lysine N-acetyltransferase [Methanoculleus sp. FWC-SCC3]|uniref:Beta-lysine N-acetyltransferase n=1 Tax=Methanoculleus methanifontis TaxID=2584086 RepID=A0ABT8M2H2_9EURY|nr:putative beta-lysine N-acetyltransferase [Methanoculleus sp. FWC-SCC3]MDN7013242.1 putative beta-lysine N-acetyltransferase [Methanoculleus sp. FWC-SCC3]
MTADTVTTIGNTLVQHGRLSDRIYVMHLSPADLPEVLDDLDALAQRERYTKIFAKVPASALSSFIARSYVVEARVPGFFRGREDGYFVAQFLDVGRRRASGDLAAVLAAVREKAGDARPAALPSGWTCAPAAEDDADDLAALYGEVFATYPFPIAVPGYLRETMAGDYRYFVVRTEDGRLAAASSAEIYPDDENVEMTDFAVHPDFRGQNLSSLLLLRMEEEMRAAGLKTAFTIARALSYPINATFARAGYAWGGTLTNNTNICGGFESMNVWYRSLEE